ncbi:YhcH/YjgK/YiaL family protein [Dinghuibacter silviterrae]|uniref:YhcH/YjgK/YiaL family protein n=1 Tax=Dinghuibacter silviterrae TaxID=1539049 RepID=A0A4R8DT88_9BACT|nr:YhcH/YjgK/YiaL family protein [Dinghuibacter silviterrae]TDX01106.1 YhcH/YjgK/YiaL family protein [Dinghuibacter silviterrae]
MKTISIRLLLTLCLAAGALGLHAQDTTASYWTRHKAETWVHKGEWRKGLTGVNPHASVNPVDFALQYHRNPVLWDKVFAWIRTNDLQAIAPGKYPIDGDNAWAIVTQGPTKAMDTVKWESHRQYIDVHYVISGKERIGVASLDNATVTEPFTDKSDNAHYTVEGTFYTAEPGIFFLFFPHDVHRPGIIADGSPTDKKLVIKIRVSP